MFSLSMSLITCVKYLIFKDKSSHKTEKKQEDCEKKGSSSF